jgi:hypothetical protein
MGERAVSDSKFKVQDAAESDFGFKIQHSR